MSGRRTKQLRKLYLGGQIAANPYKRPVARTFRQFKRCQDAVRRPKPPVEHALTSDTRDKTNWAHGKMKRAGYYATRKRA